MHKAGQRHLGAAVGSTKFIAAYLNRKVASWVAQVDRLAAIATTRHHAAYVTFIFELQHRWTFLQHSIPTASEHMQLLKVVVHGKLIPMQIKHKLNDVELKLVTLPACYGGMSLNDPVADSHRKHTTSIECITLSRFTALILQGEFELPRKAFFDTRVFYPHAASYRSRALPSLYRQFIW